MAERLLEEPLEWSFHETVAAAGPSTAGPSTAGPSMRHVSSRVYVCYLMYQQPLSIWFFPYKTTVVIRIM